MRFEVEKELIFLALSLLIGGLRETRFPWRITCKLFLTELNSASILCLFGIDFDAILSCLIIPGKLRFGLF